MPGLAGLSCRSNAVVLAASLLLAGQARQAVGEGVGDAEFHHDSGQ
jgi:hypothetical protein